MKKRTVLIYSIITSASCAALLVLASIPHFINKIQSNTVDLSTLTQDYVITSDVTDITFSNTSNNAIKYAVKVDKTRTKDLTISFLEGNYTYDGSNSTSTSFIDLSRNLDLDNNYENTYVNRLVFNGTTTLKAGYNVDGHGITAIVASNLYLSLNDNSKVYIYGGDAKALDKQTLNTGKAKIYKLNNKKKLTSQEEKLYDAKVGIDGLNGNNSAPAISTNTSIHLFMTSYSEVTSSNVPFNIVDGKASNGQDGMDGNNSAFVDSSDNYKNTNYYYGKASNGGNAGNGGNASLGDYHFTLEKAGTNTPSISDLYSLTKGIAGTKGNNGDGGYYYNDNDIKEELINSYKAKDGSLVTYAYPYDAKTTYTS